MTALALHDTDHRLNARLLRFRSQPELTEALALAEELLESGRYGDARGVAVQAQSEDANDVRLLVLEGRAWLLERELMRAQQALLDAARVDPRHAPTFRYLGEVLLERGDPLRAQKAFERCLTLDPACHEAEALRERAVERAQVPEGDAMAETAVEASGVMRVADVEEQARREAELRALEVAEEQARLEAEALEAAEEQARLEAEALEAAQAAEEQARFEAEQRQQAEAQARLEAAAREQAAREQAAREAADEQAQRETVVAAEPAVPSQPLVRGPSATMKWVVPPPPPPEAFARQVAAAQPVGEEPSFFEPPAEARRTANGRTSPGVGRAPTGDTWPGLSSPGLVVAPAAAHVDDERPTVEVAEHRDDVEVEASPTAAFTQDESAAVGLLVSEALEALEAEELDAVEPQPLFPSFETLPGATTPGIDAPLDSEAWHDAGASAAAELEDWAAAERPEPSSVDVAAPTTPWLRDEAIADAGAELPTQEGVPALRLALDVDSDDDGELSVPRVGNRWLRTTATWVAVPALMATGYYGWQHAAATPQGAEWLARARNVDVVALAREGASKLSVKLPFEWQSASASKPVPSAAAATPASAAPVMAAKPAVVSAVPAPVVEAKAATAAAFEGLDQAKAALEAGQYQDALEALTAIAARHPDAGDVQHLLGQARLGLGDVPGALEAFGRAVALAPSTAHRAALADAELLAGRYAEATTRFAELATAEPANAQWVLGHASALLAQGQAGEAQTRLAALSEEQAAEPAARVVLARVALAQSRPVAAIEALSPLAQAGELQPAALALYADALYADDRVNQAAATYEASLAADPDSAEALVGRAEVHLRAERPADALPLLRSAQDVLTRAPRGTELLARMYMLLGHAYLQRARPEDRESASQALAKAVSLPGAPHEAHFWLGEAQGGRQTSRATESYLRYLQLAPNGRYAVRARRALGPLL